MYKPDRAFMGELKRIDRRLDVKFNGRHFVITFNRGYGEPVNIWVVKTESGGFRQPDSRDLGALHRGDLARMRPDEYLRMISQHFEDYREKTKAKFHEEMRNRTKDDNRQLKEAFRQVVLGDPKANATFRRVNVKPKPAIRGKVVLA